MNDLRWLVDHAQRIVTTIVLFSIGILALSGIIAHFFGETDEARQARQRREARARTLARYNAIAEEYKRRARAKHEAAMTAIVASVIASLGVSEKVARNTSEDIKRLGEAVFGASRDNPVHNQLSCAVSVIGTDYDALERFREAEGAE